MCAFLGGHHNGLTGCNCASLLDTIITNIDVNILCALEEGF